MHTINTMPWAQARDDLAKNQVNIWVHFLADPYKVEGIYNSHRGWVFVTTSHKVLYAVPSMEIEISKK